MKVKAQNVSTKRDNKTYCSPSYGYNTDGAIEVELDQYEEICTVPEELPESDEKFPKGAPLDGYIKVGKRILKRKL